eukprot:CAMPEP_0114500248 /NCGR_PEP_ID=MMETSP0109-20121206/7858_1 /TAXON_ID=29199 /ORGANISM="Chlorarachnion reptans, Strain CCCM449" /LENGTH=90 /DNA_ID=CAMNT_0001677887 /DNA_START=159 /DNA_END=427 /DNA_ORIENTATION=+
MKITSQEYVLNVVRAPQNPVPTHALILLVTEGCPATKPSRKDPAELMATIAVGPEAGLLLVALGAYEISEPSAGTGPDRDGGIGLHGGPA